MAPKIEITLNNLTAALRTIYGDKIAVPLLIFRHWAKANYDLQQATPELLEETAKEYQELYASAPSMPREDALALLEVYDRHLHRTSTAEERREIAIAVGYTPVQFKVKEEGFSLRELMQALKFLDDLPAHLPEQFLICCFERYCRNFLGEPGLIDRISELLALYRRVPAMASDEHAKAILSAFGVKLLDQSNPEDLQVWKQVSGARDH